MQISESEVYKLNGKPLPVPSSSTASWEDVHSPNSGRTLDATMHIEIVARKRKVTLSWDVLHQEQMKALQALLQGVYYTLTYLDPLYGAHTIQCYVSSTQQDDAVGNPFVRAGDILSVSTNAGTFRAVVMSKVWDNGRDTLRATGARQRSSQSSSLNYQLQRLSGRTNELVRTVDETRSTLTDLDQNLHSEISQTAEAIRTEVVNGDKALQSTITQTAEAIRTEVSDGGRGVVQ